MVDERALRDKIGWSKSRKAVGIVAWWIAVGPAGSSGPAGTIPANLAALSNGLSTTDGVSFTGAETFMSAACNNLNVGDVILSVNG